VEGARSEEGRLRAQRPVATPSLPASCGHPTSKCSEAKKLLFDFIASGYLTSRGWHL